MAKRETNPQDASQQPSFEEALDKLEASVHQLEEGDLGLNEALAVYEQGVKLLRHCYQLLEGAERRIELLSGVDAEGKPVTTPMDDAATTLDEKAQRRSRRRSTAEERPAPPGNNPTEGEGDMDVPRGLF